MQFKTWRGDIKGAFCLLWKKNRKHYLYSKPEAMRKAFALFSVLILIFSSAQLNAQCTGGRYHDLIFPGSPDVTYDVQYGQNLNYLGQNEILKMDIYEPACDNATNRALVVFTHGGSFVTGDKGDASYVQTAVALAQLGYVVANINYRLGFEQTFPAIVYSFNAAIMRGVHDGRAAIRYMRNNALNGGNTYGIDPNKIYFGGVSAGGIIALHLGYQNTQSEHNLACNNLPGSECNSIEGTSNNLAVSSSVNAIVSIAGGIRDTSWIKNNDIPIFLAHGTNDGTVPYGSGYWDPFQYYAIHGSLSIAARCNNTGTKYCFKPMYGQDHVPSNIAYIDTVSTIMRNFLEHLTCGITLNCNYTTSPAIITPASSSVSIALTAGTNPTCSGQSVTFTATPTNGGGAPSYQWKKNGSNVGTNSSTFSTSSLANNDVITCVMTPDVCPAGNPVTSNSITMSITAGGAAAVSITITSGSNPMCVGAAVTFRATPTNGGSSPTYQWKLNGGNVGTNTNTYSPPSVANNDVISCVMTSNSACANPTQATSNSITMTVTTAAVPSVSIAITAGTNSGCSGLPVTFTATPTNGGTPSYQWKKNGSNVGTNNPSFSSSSLVNNDVISCVMTSNATCVNPAQATSNSITMTLTNSVIPSVSIAVTSGSNNICVGESVTFTATPTNGGTPTFQWKKNSATVGSGNTFTSTTLSNNDVITCSMSSNATCANPTTAISNSITMTVNQAGAASVAIAITSGSNPTCEGESVTFTATPGNGGSAPTYQWKVGGTNAGSNSTFTSSALTNNDAVICVMTSNSSCANPANATSNTITMTVNDLPTITQNGNVLSAGISSSYQWQRNGQAIAGATNQSHTATVSGSYSVVDDNDCESQAISVTVITSMDDVAAENSFVIYPNPNNGKFNIEFEAAMNGTYTLEVKNTLGSTVHKETLNDSSVNFSRKKNITQFGKGIYIVVLTDSQKAMVTKVVAN